MALELSKKSIPPQIAILVIIASHNNITLRQLFELIKHQKHNDIVNYLSVDELFKDLNVLQLLGLVEENNGRYTITERGRLVIEKILKNYKNSVHQ